MHISLYTNVCIHIYALIFSEAFDDISSSWSFTPKYFNLYSQEYGVLLHNRS